MAKLYMKLGLCYYKCSQMQYSLISYHHALKINKQFHHNEDSELIVILLEICKVYIKICEYNMAIKCCKIGRILNCKSIKKTEIANKINKVFQIINMKTKKK